MTVPNVLTRAGGAYAIAAATLLILLVGAPAALAGDVRFLHAVPGAGEAELVVEVDGSETPLTAGFGKSAAASTRDGEASLTLRAGDKTLAETGATLSEEGTTVIAVKDGEKISLEVLDNEAPESGQARMRVVHAAPELDETDVLLNRRVAAESVAPGDATDYASYKPGNYDLQLREPGGEGEAFAQATLAANAGTSWTAVVVGSSGEQLRVVALEDGTTAPSEAPDTGQGALASGSSVPRGTALAAGALLGALCGQLLWMAARRRIAGSHR